MPDISPLSSQSIDRSGDFSASDTLSSNSTDTDGSSTLESPTVKIKTDLLAIKISLSSGDLYEAKLLDYPVSLKEPNEPVRLLHQANPDLFIAQSGLYTASDSTVIPKIAEFSVPKLYYELQEGQNNLIIPLVWEDKNGVKVTKTYIFQRDSYKINLDIKIENGMNQAWTGQAYAQFTRTPPESGGIYANRSYVGTVFSTKEHEYQKVKFSDLDSKPFEISSLSGWVAMLQHYFVAAWIPQSGSEINYYYGQRTQNSHYVTGVMSPQQTLNPGESKEFKFALFAGPKIWDQLADAAPRLQLTIDYGKLTIIAEPLFWLLSWFYKLVNNWGWSIVLLTLVVKLAFFKLSQTSYRSMARLRKLQPRLLAIKERYGSDRHKVGQAMMELYKKEKVNPMGGCLPIIVQIPVFIALYWMLLESIELRQAPFILWIHDLTSKDSYYILPLLMGASMIIQQKLSPTPADPMQAKIMTLMPIMFTFFFALFPAGLVLYWVVNNILSITQQWYITRQIEREF
ncbi:membrane protein insertase [Candidatus Nitrosoglobus terrae]|uniref:Membrane protein insertase YidC n=2 Tax=Candidatus Nitrosoglobus terrae TaxID=1630141 RepID=A0A1Q2SPY8_9GAMM|nr:membrane protein insertase [Candidatus Nitrosoglobus terrae]